MTSPRTPSTSFPTSGFQQIQTLYTDSMGQVVSGGGVNEIWKYWNNSSKEIFYQKTIPEDLFVFVGAYDTSFAYGAFKQFNGAGGNYMDVTLTGSTPSAIENRIGFYDGAKYYFPNNADVAFTVTPNGELVTEFSTVAMARNGNIFGAIKGLGYTSEIYYSLDAGESWSAATLVRENTTNENCQWRDLKYLNGYWILTGQVLSSDKLIYAYTEDISGSWTTFTGDDDGEILAVGHDGTAYYFWHRPWNSGSATNWVQLFTTSNLGGIISYSGAYEMPGYYYSEECNCTSNGKVFFYNYSNSAYVLCASAGFVNETLDGNGWYDLATVIYRPGDGYYAIVCDDAVPATFKLKYGTDPLEFLSEGNPALYTFTLPAGSYSHSFCTIALRS